MRWCLTPTNSLDTMTKYILYKMFKFSFLNVSINISIPNHILDDFFMSNTHKIIIDHRNLVYLHGKKYTKKKNLSSKIKVHKMYIATPINQPLCHCTHAFVNSLSWPNTYHLIISFYFKLGLHLATNDDEMTINK